MNSISITENHAVSKDVTAAQEPQLDMAVKCFIARQNRVENPNGHFDNAKRWEPNRDEKCVCCCFIRTPSRNFPYSLMAHCRTITHVANLHNVDESKLRKAVHAFKKSLATEKSSVETFNG